MSRTRRQGVTILELLIALTILALGLLPYFDMLRGARGILGESQEMLLLENQAMQALAEARALIASGDLVALEADEEEVLEATEGGLDYEIVVRRGEDRRRFEVTVRAESDDRFFQLTQVVSDPLASMFRIDEGELPDPADPIGHAVNEGVEPDFEDVYDRDHGRGHHHGEDH